MRTLNFRRAARTSALGAVALVASLSLTACQGDDPEPYDALPSASAGSASKTPAESAGASGDKGTAAPDADQGKDATGSGSGGGTSTTKPKDDSGNGGSGSGSGDNANTATVTCTGGNTKLSITEISRPVNHMLLTMTNTGSKACNAYYYPYLKFGEAQSVPNTFEDSKPQAVVTINPGESAYAGVMTSSADGSGSNGYSAKDLSVSFQNRDGNSDNTGSSVSVPLSKSVHVDSSLTVSYWQMSMDDALTY
ncbi:DUF4232 domain-containing protein [Streptomyces sp. NBC_01358]|uniref:DUF4232 domain-containing protein n=1 Tax=Streptomyces sp. NBC_01358 TaxID=2903837 RepID=UPI002E324D98|nr:DUF4232 domain-containing protein [Streptomyces sp. NBC_01358]